MPFKSFVAHAFTPVAIRAHAPRSPGVYGISSAKEWIYIGEADDIQNMLMPHLSDGNSLLMARHPTGFVFEMCHPAMRAARQDRLVMEYEPICNRSWDQHQSGARDRKQG